MQLHNIILGSLFLLGGCNAVDSVLEARQATLSERAAVQKYSGSVETTQSAQRSWTSAVRQSNQLTSPQAVKTAVTNKVVPALLKYLTAVNQMPLDADELRPIHQSMTAALSTLLDHYRAFSKDLDRVNYAARRKTLQAAFAEFTVAQRRYRDRLSDYYKSLGLALEPPRVGDLDQN